MMANGHSPTTWDRVTTARHPSRPRTLDYVGALCNEFIEYRGDRQYRDDRALVGGPAMFRGRSVMILGHQKGRDTRENLDRNFGMVRPEGYRKALRLMRHAARFEMPVLTFVDTPGADPGPSSEEHGQAFAIAECIAELLRLPVPVISVVIGEGGSGGALAIGVANRIIMLENSVYSVASPEAAASILWRDSSEAPAAAAAMRITAPDLLELGIIDEVLPEQPPAHEDPAPAFATTADAIERQLTSLQQAALDQDGHDWYIHDRRDRYRAIGAWQEAETRELVGQPGS